jgi:hypothetical protein
MPGFVVFRGTERVYCTLSRSSTVILRLYVLGLGSVDPTTFILILGWVTQENSE